MKTIKNKKVAPNIGCEVKDMLPLEQVLCMIFLADNCTLKELRHKQVMIKEQLNIAYKKQLPEKAHANLGMMADNMAAAVAYQIWPEEDFWLAFIQIGDK